MFLFLMLMRFFSAVAERNRHTGGMTFTAALLAPVFFFGAVSTALGGEDLYDKLSQVARSKEDISLFNALNTASRNLDWSAASESEFIGHLRLLRAEDAIGTDDETRIYMVRSTSGELHILSVPHVAEIERAGEDSPYFNLSDLMGMKLSFSLLEKQGVVDGETYSFVRFRERPSQLLFDRVFKISIILMLFFVMVGMGLTLTVNDFKLVLLRPKGIVTGAALQWVVMPLIAVAMGHLMGFYHAFPFIFAGMVLITVSPGGVTSNLMTYYAKGDLALSISLTSFSTVLSLFFTPFLLALYCANIEDVIVPVGLIVQTIIILVIIPLAVGMTVRAFWMEFAKRATPFFSILGIIALLFLILAGVLGNLEVFTDTERYGPKFYVMVFMLTILGMVVGGVIARLLGVDNYQTRAVSLETGLRNASLAMAIAILIQDHMGDFYSSMFITSAIFGLLMYVAGFISIAVFKKLLPVETTMP